MKILELIVAEIFWIIFGQYTWATISLCCLPMIFHSSVLYGIASLIVYLIMIAVGIVIAIKILSDD